MRGKLLKTSAARLLKLATPAILMSGCGPTPDTQITDVANSQRITVERIAVIQDSIAYEGKRGVYVIRDTQTGKEYFGISGVGVTELGSHSIGKTRAEDER